MELFIDGTRHTLSVCSSYLEGIFIDPKRMVSVGGLFFLMFSGVHTLLYRRYIAVRELALFAPVSLVGVWFGTTILTTMTPDTIFALAAILLWVVGIRRFITKPSGMPKKKHPFWVRVVVARLGVLAPVCAGSLSGLLQGLGAKSGLIRVGYFAARLKRPQAIIATSAVVSTANLILATSSRFGKSYITAVDFAVMVPVLPFIVWGLWWGKHRVVEPNGNHRWVPGIITSFILCAALFITGLWVCSV